MASSGYRLIINEEKGEKVKEPLEHVSETGEYICGWCGQLLIPNHNNQTPQEHFKSCNKDNGLLKVFKNQRRVQQSLKVLNEKMDRMKTEVMEEIKADHIRMNEKMDTMKTEVMEELRADHIRMKTEFNNDILAFKEKMKVDLKTLNTADSGREKNNDLQVIKRQMENGEATCESSATKKMRLHVEPPSPSEQQRQLTIPMNSFNLVAHNNLFQPSYTWIIDEIEKKMERETFELSSDLFQWNGHPFHARANLQLREGDDRVYTALRLKDVSLQAMDSIIPRVFYVLKDGVSKQKSFRRHKCAGMMYLPGPLDTALQFELPFAHKSCLNHPPYKVSDWVKMEIYVEPPQMTQQVYSNDGTLEWNMVNYARKLQLEKDELVAFQESPYFYSSPRGYRVQMEVFLNGYEEKGLTARILFVSGNYDGKLRKSFPHSTTVTLVHRKGAERSVAKTVEENIEEKRFYDVEICKLEEVENFLKNDTLFFKVSVESQKKTIKAKLK